MHSEHTGQYSEYMRSAGHERPSSKAFLNKRTNDNEVMKQPWLTGSKKKRSTNVWCFGLLTCQHHTEHATRIVRMRNGFGGCMRLQTPIRRSSDNRRFASIIARSRAAEPCWLLLPCRHHDCMIGRRRHTHTNSLSLRSAVTTWFLSWGYSDERHSIQNCCPFNNATAPHI